MTKPADITGQVFGKLTALHRVENTSVGRHTQWLCRCECGRETITRANGLKSGNTKTCGQCPNRIDHFGDTIIIWLERKNKDPLPCFVDAADYPLVKDYRWHATTRPVERTRYAESGDSSKVKMHNIILPVDNGFEVDHIDHDGLNNRRENLRPGSHSQNAQNRRKFRKASSSQFKGVTFSKQHKKFRAYVNVKNKRHNLGLFELEEDAARAYNEAAKKHFGEFAELNEVNDVSNLILNGVYVNGPLRGQKPKGGNTNVNR